MYASLGGNEKWIRKKEWSSGEKMEYLVGYNKQLKLHTYKYTTEYIMRISEGEPACLTFLFFSLFLCSFTRFWSNLCFMMESVFMLIRCYYKYG